jgi:hypothetical protein
MKLTIKSIVLAASLALPTFFAGNVFAQAAPSSCGANCTSASANPHGYTSGMTVNCYACHSMPVVTPTPTPKPTPTPTPKPTTPPVVTPPATGAVTPHSTSKSCGACVKGTAPSSVSAHKNVNSTMTACSVCHGGSSTGGTGGGTTGGGTTGGGTTGGTTSGSSDDNHSSTGSSSGKRGHGSRGNHND